MTTRPPVADWTTDWDHLDPAGTVTWSEGTVRGPRQLPMLFGKT